MKKKRPTAAQLKVKGLEFKIEMLTKEAAEGNRVAEQYRKERDQAKLSLATVTKILKEATYRESHVEVMPDFYGDRNYSRREQTDAPSEETQAVNTAVEAAGLINRLKGREGERRHLDNLAALEKIDIQAERDKVIAMAMENPREYAIDTDLKTGMVSVHRITDGRRIL